MDTEAEAVQQNESSPELRGGPRGLAKRWSLEIGAAKENLRASREAGRKAVKRYLAEQDAGAKKKSKLNLFHSDVNVIRSLLLGRLPQTDVERRHHDQDDDEARVGADVLARTLDAEIDSADDGYVGALKQAIEDWTLPGLGVARVRYEIGEEEVIPGAPAIMKQRENAETGELEEYEAAPEVPETTRRPEEEAEAEYVYWEDFLYGPARTWRDVPWVAFGCPMRERPFVKRFGKKSWSAAPKRSSAPKESGDDDDLKRVWSEVYVWEIWEKETREVVWFVEGMDRVLDRKADPLKLKGFFPCPRPLFANTTTTKLVPKPDLELARDLYDEIDEITARITLLQRAAKVAGVYDASQPEIPRLVEEACENELIACESWLTLAEKGGLQAIVQFMPLGDIVKAIDLLSRQRFEKMQLLHQVTGLSDVVRGQQDRAETATTTKVKASFASTRVQTAQDEVARFASQLQKLRAEIAAKHFAPETFIERSNVLRTKDAQRAQQAVGLIQRDIHGWRVQIKPESMSLPDMAQLKQQRTEILTALATYFQGMMPFLQLAAGQGPEAAKAALDFVVDAAKWLVAGLRGSSEVEAAFDRFTAQAQKIAMQPKPPSPPDPALEAEKIRAQAEAGKARATMQQTAMDAQLAQAEHRMGMEKLSAEVAANRAAAATKIAVAQAAPPLTPGAAHGVV
jgi:hypothetical protein